jgi:hypothetical protein
MVTWALSLIPIVAVSGRILLTSHEIAVGPWGLFRGAHTCVTTCSAWFGVCHWHLQ